MTNETEKTTALVPSVGADGGQPLHNSTDNNIPQNADQYNPKIVNCESSFPVQIIQNGRFCCWRYEQRSGRKTKVPYTPLTGQLAKSNDRNTFSTFEEAIGTSGYDGIGIGIFNGICAIDLDDCVTDSGFYTETAAEIVALMHSYTEFSPSGNGLHILFHAENFTFDADR